MAGFETVVRPSVFPDIRPKPAQTLPPADDPDKGFCVIRGNPAKSMDLTTSWSNSTSKSHNVETERRVDTARVYQQNDDGSINRDNFVDVEVPNRITMRTGKMPVLNASAEAATQKAKREQERYDKWFYQRTKGVDQGVPNIEIRLRDQIKPAQDPFSEDA